MYPDFIGIGAQKAGTTWLSRNLQAHPEIWMPRIKEIHYFNKLARPQHREPGSYLGRRLLSESWRRQVGERLRAQRKNFDLEVALWDLRYYLLPPGDRWYASLFGAGEGRVTGEITPAYSALNRKAVARVHGLMPQTKILFMMRNPIERAWSQASMFFGNTAGKDAADVPEPAVRRYLDGRSVRLRTGYRRTLDNWLRFYPRERVFVGFLEDVHFFPARFLVKTYDFLGVDRSFRPPGLRRKIHSLSGSTIPTEIAAHLAETYHEDLKALAGRFGGYADFWLYGAGRLIEGSFTEESLPYPLWESSLWQDWAEGRGLDPAMTGGGVRLPSGVPPVRRPVW